MILLKITMIKWMAYIIHNFKEIKLKSTKMLINFKIKVLRIVKIRKDRGLHIKECQTLDLR
jgi:hypothetical protein